MNKNNIEIITLENIKKKITLYEKFSCQPINKKYKEGTVFDEEKSVRWNREEVIRRNKLHDEEVKTLNQKKNAMYNDVVNDIILYIKQEVDVSDERAKKIWRYLSDNYHAHGFIECLAHLNDLLDIFR